MISIHPYNIIQSIFSALKILYAISIYPYPAPQPLSTTNLFTVSIVLSFPECNIVVQLLSHLCNPMDCSMPSFPVHHHLPEFVQIHIHWVGDAIRPSHLLSPLLFLPSIFPSIRVFYNESAAHIRWPKYWSFNFSISPSNEYSGFISFKIDWFYLAVQGTFRSLLQYPSLKASILWCSTLFMVQLS